MTEENNQPLSGSIQLDEPTKETYTFNVVKGYWDNPNNSALSFSNKDIKQILKITIGGEFIWCDDPIDRIENGVYGDQMQWMQPFLRKMYQFTHPITYSVKIIKLNDDYCLTLNRSDKPFDTANGLTVFKSKDLEQVYTEAKVWADFLNVPFENSCNNAYKQAKDLQDAIDNESKEP